MFDRHEDARTNFRRIGGPRRAPAWIAAALVVLVVGGPMPRASADDPPRPAGVVYVEGDDPAGNAIFAYRRGADGRLAPLPGSPFPARGRGVTPTFDLGPFDSDQNLVADPARSLLFAVNGGSDSIAVFRIAADGSLTHVEGSPFPSGGPNPVSVGLASGILTVVNKDEDPAAPGRGVPNYTTFRVTPRGKLIPVPHSTFPVDPGASPTQALPSPDGGLIFGADFFGGLIRSFRLGDNGRLDAASALAPPEQEFAGGAPPFPLGLAAHPGERLLYVGFVTINRIGVYGYDGRGVLGFLRSVPDSGAAPCWLVVNKAGTRLYASNTADPSISVYDIEADPAEPAEIQRLPLRSNGSSFQFALDPGDRFLHVVTQQATPHQNATANALNVLKVRGDGTLEEVPSSPTLLPVRDRVRPQGVVAF